MTAQTMIQHDFGLQHRPEASVWPSMVTWVKDIHTEPSCLRTWSQTWPSAVAQTPNHHGLRWQSLQQHGSSSSIQLERATQTTGIYMNIAVVGPQSQTQSSAAHWTTNMNIASDAHTGHSHQHAPRPQHDSATSA